jgi:hypothetical protein
MEPGWLDALITVLVDAAMARIEEWNSKEYVYAGMVQKHAKRYRVIIRHEGTTLFYDSFITKEEAERYRVEISNKYGLTNVRYVSYYERGLKIPEEIKQMLAGFFEGDGDISISRNQTMVKLSQSCDSGEPPELIMFRKYYGGALRLSAKSKGRRRTRWILVIQQESQVVPLIEDLSQRCPLKSEQLKLTLKWWKDGRGDSTVAQTLECMHIKSYYQQVKIDASMITLSYLGGLFTADGCCVVANGISIKAIITQKISPSLLYEIKRFSGFGSVYYEKDWVCHGQNAISFLQQIRPYVFGAKIPQLELLLEWVLRTDRKSAKEDRSKTKHECSRLKRL